MDVNYQYIFKLLECHPTCKICEITATKCTSCEASDFRIYDNVLKVCVCMSEYFDYGNNLCVVECGRKCETCVSKTDKYSCQSC